MRPSSVRIPERMAALPRDARGFPVPYVVLRDADGTPHFVVNDSELMLRCATMRLCGICGSALEQVVWFIGGVRNAFHRNGGYNDPPMHDECAHYALQVCPFLAVRSYKGANLEAAKGRVTTPNVGFVNNTSVPGKPVMFVAVAAGLARPTLSIGSGQITYEPKRPHRKIEYWRDGVQLAFAEGKAIRDAVMSGAIPPTVVRTP